LKVLEDLHYFLGVEIVKSNKGIHLCQRKSTLQLLQDIGFISEKAALVPMDPNISLKDKDGTALPDASVYRRLLGRLMYPNESHSQGQILHMQLKPVYATSSHFSSTCCAFCVAVLEELSRLRYVFPCYINSKSHSIC
jgi:hypothetical protein